MEQKVYMLLFVLKLVTCKSVHDQLHEKFTNDYNPKIRPFLGTEPVNIAVSIYIGSLRSISEQSMDYKLEVYFREYWQDPRLRFEPEELGLTGNESVNLHESLSSLLWIPDTFFPNAIHSLNPTATSITHRSLLRLEPSGFILMSRRLSVTAECPMDLSLYPFDIQVCLLSIESYGGNIADIRYNWQSDNAVTINDRLKLPVFRLTKVMQKDRNITLATGTYSRLETCFVFTRSAGFYFVQIFIPAAAIVATAWLSLWMEEDSEFSDMVEVILAITFLYYSYNSMMPKVSYIKAMDVFLGICFVFVFLALVKLVVMKLLHMKINDRSNKVYSGAPGTVITPKTPNDLIGTRLSNRHSIQNGNIMLRRFTIQSDFDDVHGLPEYQSKETFGSRARHHRKSTRSFIPRMSGSSNHSVRSLKRHRQCLSICKILSLVFFPLGFVTIVTFYFVFAVLLTDNDAMKRCMFD